MTTEHLLERNLSKVLLPAEVIARRVAELGAQISREYAGKDLLLVGILKGSVLFLSDLTRCIGIPHAVDFIAAASYGAGTTSSGNVRILKDLNEDVAGKHVLIIEDIYDTGRTLRTVIDLVARRKPAGLKVCSLLVKNRPHEAEVRVDYPGFEIPDEFVVGYGLDYNEHYRNLPMIGVLSRSVYAPGTH